MFLEKKQLILIIQSKMNVYLYFSSLKKIIENKQPDLKNILNKIKVVILIFKIPSRK